MADFGTHLSKLQMLKLSKNEITTVVDEAFSKLTRLSQLDLSYNRLRVSLNEFIHGIKIYNPSSTGSVLGQLKCHNPYFIFIASE